MDDAVAKLLELQEKDQRIAKLQAQIDSVPKEKNRITTELQGAEAILDTAKHGVMEVEARIKTLELDIAKHKNKITDVQNKLPNVKKNDEYRALIAEIETAKGKIAGVEDRELEEWEALEAAKVKRAAAEAVVKQQSARIDAAISDLNTRLSNCQGQLQKLQAERDTIAAQVPAEILGEYDRTVAMVLRHGNFRLVLVPLLGENCGGCHLKLTPSVKQRTLRGEVVRCEQCSALLYHAD